MNPYLVLIFLALLAVPAISQSYKCLPDDVKADELVGKTATVKQTLKKLKARCNRGKLVDRKNRQIRFYRVQGCWGNPPADYLDILDAQSKEIADLKKRFTVIEMACYTGGPMPH